jgi:hypothetical protein
MARKWEISEGVFAWNMEESEELYLIAGYEEIKRYITPQAQWAKDFEQHFYHHGNGIAFAFIDQINAERRRRFLPTLEFTETDVLEYGRSTNKLMKSERRRQVREEINSVSLDIRQRLVNGALAKMQILQPPHLQYDEFKARKRRYFDDSLLSRAEASRRVQATQIVAAPQNPPEPQTPNLPIEKALLMLKYATNAELRLDIISKLSADDALEAVERIEDDEVRDALIRHSLKAA